MKQKLFMYVLASTLAVFGLTLLLLCLVLVRSGTAYVLLQEFTAILAIVAAAVGLSLFFAARASRMAQRPLDKIDLSRPDERDVDEEFRPLVRRLADQNRQIRAQMAALDQEHEDRDRMRREFTANVSHELKTPLTSISGFAELLRDGLVRPEDQARFAGKIYDEAQRLISLVEDIIKLSRLDDKTIVPPPEVLDLQEEAALVLRQLEPVAQRQGIALVRTGGAAPILGVRKILDEMLYNLCDNAIKYNRPGGSVTVDVAAGEENTVSVTDTGIGIPQEDLPRIFERFYRVDKSHSKEVGGTGLGLSIVKHGAACHSARIEVDSALGRGTKVTLVFPKMKNE